MKRLNLSQTPCYSYLQENLQEISASFAGIFDFQLLLPGRKTFFLALTKMSHFILVHDLLAIVIIIHF